MAKQWYIVHTYSGFEKKVKESLEGRVAAFGLTDKIGQIVIPTESVVEVRGGKKVISPRMCYPGYVLVEMDMDDYTWHVVRSTPRVTGFRGLRADAFAADRRGSAEHSEPRDHHGGEAEAEAVVRSRRKSAHRRRPVREFHGRRRGSELGPQHAEGFGHDFWPVNSGRARFRAG